MLEPVGVTALEERIYGELLERRHACGSELAATTGTAATQTRRALAQLESLGLVSRLPGRGGEYVPAPPDVAVDALIARRKEELERTRLAATSMLERFRAAARPGEPAELVEVIAGRDAIVQRLRQLLAAATQEVLMSDRPPYVNPGDNVSTQLAILDRGVSWRALYAPEALNVPGKLAAIRRVRAAGEQARLLPQLPIKLMVVDRRLALLPLTSEDTTVVNGAVLVHSSSLLVALAALFDAWWAQAMDLPGDPGQAGAGPAPLDQVDQDLLALLAGGAKDEAIARQLGISPRTVHRRLTRLMAELKVVTRFQLAVAAANRGLL